MPKKASLKTLKNKLDKVFSEYVRIKHSNLEGCCKCYTCDKIAHWKSMQCGHFLSRRHTAIRWNEDNVRPQCPPCNGLYAGRQYQFGKQLEKDIGADEVEKLVALSNQTCKITMTEYISMIDYYRDKLADLSDLN